MLLLLAGLSLAQAAEPTGTVMLTCKGTVDTWTSKPYTSSDQINSGVMLDFQKMTITGFSGGLLKITDLT